MRSLTGTVATETPSQVIEVSGLPQRALGFEQEAITSSVMSWGVVAWALFMQLSSKFAVK